MQHEAAERREAHHTQADQSANREAEAVATDPSPPPFDASFTGAPIEDTPDPEATVKTVIDELMETQDFRDFADSCVANGLVFQPCDERAEEWATQGLVTYEPERARARLTLFGLTVAMAKVAKDEEEKLSL